jgi:hypothetical protein
MAFEKFTNLLRNAFAKPVEELTESLGEAASFPPPGPNLLHAAQSYDDTEVFGEVVFLSDDMRQTLDFKM